MYGIRVRQEYFSSNYVDVGYLFLLIDLRNEVAYHSCPRLAERKVAAGITDTIE